MLHYTLDALKNARNFSWTRQSGSRNITAAMTPRGAAVGSITPKPLKFYLLFAEPHLLFLQFANKIHVRVIKKCNVRVPKNFSLIRTRTVF
jgi:hypothetical protein